VNLPHLVFVFLRFSIFDFVSSNTVVVDMLGNMQRRYIPPTFASLHATIVSALQKLKLLQQKRGVDSGHRSHGNDQKSLLVHPTCCIGIPPILARLVWSFFFTLLSRTLRCERQLHPGVLSIVVGAALTKVIQQDSGRESFLGFFPVCCMFRRRTCCASLTKGPHLHGT